MQNYRGKLKEALGKARVEIDGMLGLNLLRGNVITGKVEDTYSMTTSVEVFIRVQNIGDICRRKHRFMLIAHLGFLTACFYPLAVSLQKTTLPFIYAVHFSVGKVYHYLNYLIHITCAFWKSHNSSRRVFITKTHSYRVV